MHLQILFILICLFLNENMNMVSYHFMTLTWNYCLKMLSDTVYGCVCMCVCGGGGGWFKQLSSFFGAFKNN